MLYVSINVLSSSFSPPLRCLSFRQCSQSCLLDRFRSTLHRLALIRFRLNLCRLVGQLFRESPKPMKISCPLPAIPIVLPFLCFNHSSLVHSGFLLRLCYACVRDSLHNAHHPVEGTRRSVSSRRNACLSVHDVTTMRHCGISLSCISVISAVRQPHDGYKGATRALVFCLHVHPSFAHNQISHTVFHTHSSRTHDFHTRSGTSF